MRFLLTSDITTELLENADDPIHFVSWQSLMNYLNDSLPTVLNFCVKIIIALIVIFVGRRIIRALKKFIHKLIAKTQWDETLKNFIEHALTVLMHFALIMLVLAGFGVTTSSVIAIVGSVGLSVGLAMQGTLSNIAGGFLILVMRPFKVGDYIYEDSHGNEGTVTDIHLIYTKLITLDHRQIVLPNGTLANASLTNLTKDGKRNITVITGISYDSDIRLAKKALAEVADAEPSRLEGEPVTIYVDELSDSSVNLGLRILVNPDDYWYARWRLIENIKYKFDEYHIEIPLPQVVVNQPGEKNALDEKTESGMHQ